MRQTFKNEGCGVGVARLIASSDRHCFETFQVVLEIFDIPPEVKIVDKMAHCRGSSVGGLKCEGVKLGDVVSWWRSLFLFSHRFMLVWTCWSCFGVWERSGSEGACDICFFYWARHYDLVQWFLTFFTYLTPFYQTRIPDLLPIHSTVLVYWKYEINKLISLEWFIKIYIGCNLWFSKFTPLEDEIYLRGVNLPQVKNHWFSKFYKTETLSFCKTRQKDFCVNQDAFLWPREQYQPSWWGYFIPAFLEHLWVTVPWYTRLEQWLLTLLKALDPGSFIRAFAVPLVGGAKNMVSSKQSHNFINPQNEPWIGRTLNPWHRLTVPLGARSDPG